MWKKLSDLGCIYDRSNKKKKIIADKQLIEENPIY